MQGQTEDCLARVRAGVLWVSPLGPAWGDARRPGPWGGSSGCEACRELPGPPWRSGDSAGQPAGQAADPARPSQPPARPAPAAWAWVTVCHMSTTHHHRGGVSFTAPDPDPAGRRGTPRQPPPHPGWAEPGELLSQHLWPLQWARASISLGSGFRSLKKRHTKGLRGGDGWPFSRPLPPRAAAAQAELTPTRATEGHGRSRRLPSAEHSWRVGETDVGTPGSWAAWWGVDHEGEGLGPCAPGSSRLPGGHPITCLTPCAPFWWPCSFDPRRLP